MSTVDKLCPIVLACDSNYAMPLAAMIASLAEAHPGTTLDLWLLTKGFSPELRNKVQASTGPGSATFHWETVDLRRFEGYNTPPHVSEMTFARLLIPNIVPRAVERVLYLDTDMLVLQNLMPLMQAELNGAVIGAVDDGLAAGSPMAKGIPQVKRYFNAGMLLIDVPKWRECRVSERALEYLVAHPDTPYGDQDALNAVCCGNWKAVDSRWNFQAHHDKSLAKMTREQRPAVVHFITSSKPWNLEAVSINADFFDQYRSRTPFAKPTGQVLRDRITREWYRLVNRVRRTF